MKDPRNQTPKSLLVKILQWFYLLLGITTLPLPFWYQQQAFSKSLGLPTELIYGLIASFALYCLLLFVSFLLQNTNLLILSLVFIFFTTIGGLALLAVAFPNADNLIQHGLPECAKNLSTCSFQDGIIVAAAGALAIAVPLLIINIITIIGAVKAIAATD
jgi:hypothetical protein